VNATMTGSRGVTVGPPTPTGLVATATSTTQVTLTWNASAGATQYEVVRGTGAPIVTASANYTDNSVTAGNAYVYTVRALDASARRSPYSAPDVATTILFTDDPVLAATTLVKGVHITELRQAANALRTAAGLPAATFTDASLPGVAAKVVHVQELRTAIAPARSTLGLTTIVYTDPTLTAGTTLVKAAHVQELRNAVK
jgi:hypothetical protein